MAEAHPPDGQINGGRALAVPSSETVGLKRQRRPSVRLGDIGNQPYDSHARRTSKQWKLTLDHKKELNKSSKIRPLTNFKAAGEFDETLEGEDKEGNLDSVAIGSWRVKDSKKQGFTTTKRVRSNWVSKADEIGNGEEGEKYSGGEDFDDRFREFHFENSEIPLKEQSPINSLENLGVDGHGSEREVVYNRGANIRARVLENRHHNDGMELSGPSDTDCVREWKSGTSVRIWLNSLGLGRYAPVFEIHEVDDEVLPMLTLEDLKDMGINAVGSRRKMYCAIQKLGKGFS